MEQDACTSECRYCLLHIEVIHTNYNNIISQNRTYTCWGGISDDL